VFDEVVACVRDVMRPYRIAVLTDDPSPQPHQEHIIAGTPVQAGFGNGTGGVSPWVCGSGIQNSISFTFAEIVGPDVLELCWTASHEIGHQFGLEHEFLSSDPMTYLETETFKFYQDALADCGEFTARNCECRDGQNTHAHLALRVGLEPVIFASGFEALPEARAKRFADDPTFFGWRDPTVRPVRCGTDTTRQGWRPTVPRTLEGTPLE
jgi:hypothetical protein